MLCVCVCITICLHNEDANPGVLSLLSPKPERVGSFFVSNSLLDSSGFEAEEDDDDDDRESKRHELHDGSKVSFCFSLEPTKRKKKKKSRQVIRIITFTAT